MASRIIGVVGLPGSGKGTVAKLIQERYGAQLYRMSGILGDVLERLALPPSRVNLRTLSEHIRAAYGEDVLAHAMARDVQSATSDIIVIDGIRRIQDLSVLEPLPQFTLMSIDAPPELRYQRMTQRGEKTGETEMTYEQFLADEQGSTELTIPAVMAKANVQLDNTGTADDLWAQIDAHLITLGISKKN